MDVLIFAVMLSQNSRRAAGSREVIAAVEGALAGDLLFRDFAEEMRTVTPSPAPLNGVFYNARTIKLY